MSLSGCFANCNWKTARRWDHGDVISYCECACTRAGTPLVSPTRRHVARDAIRRTMRVSFAATVHNDVWNSNRLISFAIRFSSLTITGLLASRRQFLSIYASRDRSRPFRLPPRQTNKIARTQCITVRKQSSPTFSRRYGVPPRKRKWKKEEITIVI